VKIAIGSDHAGFTLKSAVKAQIHTYGIDLIDVGTDSEKPVDYPDFTKKVAEAVKTKSCDRGIMICGSGVGATVAANKIKGIRASVCHDTYSAHQGVEHDDMNVLVLGARVIGTSLAHEIISSFLGAQFSREERHLRRLEKVLLIENS
jgi:RpiB/LacA/LacB family sugar-phosphate isomerase